MNTPQHLRGDYCHFQPITTRWHDNDLYGHVNNVTYYSYFDSAVNAYLIEVGLRVAKLGNSSVQYALAVFKHGEEEACAAGRFVHVFVDRQSNRPVPIPPRLRAALAELLVTAD